MPDQMGPPYNYWLPIHVDCGWASKIIVGQHVLYDGGSASSIPDSLLPSRGAR